MARHFHYKVEIFFKEIILDGPLGKTKYYVIRPFLIYNAIGRFNNLRGSLTYPLLIIALYYHHCTALERGILHDVTLVLCNWCSDAVFLYLNLPLSIKVSRQHTMLSHISRLHL